jgi:hypothetical protein
MQYQLVMLALLIVVGDHGVPLSEREEIESLASEEL